MNMKRFSIISLLLWIGILASATGKSKVMWLDCSANFQRFSYPDSIRYYVDKCHEVGITHLVLDIKDNTGEVLYPSKYAAQKKNWKNFDRPDFDFIDTFIEAAHAHNMFIFAGMNIFADGQNIVKRGAVFDKHKKWQAINYVPRKGLLPVTEIEGKPTMFLNPALKEVQKYEIDVIKEVVRNYAFDGIMLDRARYDCIDSDFSPESKKMFEKFIGKKVEKFPEDIFEWRPNAEGGIDRVGGPYYHQWLTWRSSVIYNFIKDVRTSIKKIKPECMLAAYTGAWYPTYFEVGVNWASRNYDVSKDFSWATPDYKNYGFAELLDFYTNGNYYWNVTLDDYYKSSGKLKNETDSEFSTGEYLCVEGGCKYSKYLLKDAVPVCGGLYVEDYKRDVNQFQKAVRMNLKESDGVMIFDIVHIIRNGWWNELKEALDETKLDEARMIKGTVTCDGKGIANVVVTDGLRCVTTDKNGIYNLPNLGNTRFVYITTPAGYLTDCEQTIPRFYQEIDLKKTNEYNFRLKKNPKDDSKHLFVLEADVQAGLKEHWELYAPIVDDYKQLIDQHSDRDVFGLNCGDIFWDTPATFFSPYIEKAKKLDIPIYRAIGNHDIDCNGATHETSCLTFEGYFGPTHYSFNKGNAHYIVINNNFYVGREYFYIGYVDETTFNWLKEDLSYVPKGTLVFLMTHIPTRITEQKRPFNYNYAMLAGETINAEAIHQLLDAYETHFLTGHLHSNSNIIFNDLQMEHNTAAVCGIWWHADVCIDGTPQGYGVYEVDGNQVRWYYKSAGHPKGYQFRSYAAGTSKEFPKDIIANVWNWDKNWKVEWLENGKVMGTMTQYTGVDPYAHQVCTDKKRTMQSWISAASTGHLFRATPRNPKAKIEVRVTDRFGKVYQQNVSK